MSLVGCQWRSYRTFSNKLNCRARRIRLTRQVPCSAVSAKVLYVEPLSKEALTAGLESGVETFVFQGSSEDVDEMIKLGRFRPLLVYDDGELVDYEEGTREGRVFKVSGPEDVKALEALAKDGELWGDIILDATEWKIIPAENLVALLQNCPAPPPDFSRPRLLASVGNAAEAELMLGALETGTQGVVLRTDSGAEEGLSCNLPPAPSCLALEQVRLLAQRMRLVADAAAALALPLQAVKVTRITPVGSGDRVCVDLACLMQPGEGLLVGSFARGLFLVQSECEESQYINSRPFRVNAGPVHLYVHGPSGRTAYLSELRSGDEVVIVDAAGRQRTALVGRVKVESRPLILVEAETADGVMLSVQLQNAETVKLLGPASSQGGAAARSFRAVSVAQLGVGDELLALVQEGARHTGIAIQEFIVER